MKTEFFFESCGAGRIHCCRWTPEGEVRGVVQLVHGIAEHIHRYDAFAEFLNSKGFAVVAEDHMGHGGSVNGNLGYFHGGWFAAVDDTCKLLRRTQKEYPGVPYILFGHSMGSFMVRTVLCKYPDIGISGAVLCGTGWQPTAAMPAIVFLVERICRREGQTNPSQTLQKMMFGGYNNRIPGAKTPFDWLTRDDAVVAAYAEDPLCGFTASCGLVRDMMKGICFIQQRSNLGNMKKDLPVYLIAGDQDPVGSYGKGVESCRAHFRKAGMTDVSLRLFPECRHEILNELNRHEVYEDVLRWIQGKIN